MNTLLYSNIQIYRFDTKIREKRGQFLRTHFVLGLRHRKIIENLRITDAYEQIQMDTEWLHPEDD